MNLNDFIHFAAVAQHGGFTAAARATGVEKSRLSRSVARLEETIGARLIHRSTRSVSLTDAGQRFYQGCQTVLNSARAAFDSVAELQREPAGTVRLGCSVLAAQNFLAPVLPRYLADHPKVTVIVEHGDVWINPLDHDLDVALTTRVEDLPESSLVAREIGRVRRILVAGRALTSQCAGLAHPEDLARVPLIARNDAVVDGEVRWQLGHVDDAQSVRVTGAPRLVTNDLSVQLAAVSAGIGVALVPEMIVAPAIAEGSLRHILPDWSTGEYSLHLVYPLPRGMLPSVRSFIDFLTANLWPNGRR